MILLDGKVVSKVIRAEIAESVEDFKKQFDCVPGLSVILVGDDPASQVYVKSKQRACEKLGMCSFMHVLPENVSMNEILELINKENQNDQVDGLLVQLPLPKHLDTERIVEAISPQKDVDGITPLSLGRLERGTAEVTGCTPSGVMEILKHFQIDVFGQDALVIGRSLIVGKPMAQLLLAAQATVTMSHSKTQGLIEKSRQADLVVVAAGIPEFLGKEAFKPEAVVIDVGIHRYTDGSIVGDVKFNEVKDHVRAITPVPGGVGVMTITMLMKNTLKLAQLRKLFK